MNLKFALLFKIFLEHYQHYYFYYFQLTPPNTVFTRCLENGKMEQMMEWVVFKKSIEVFNGVALTHWGRATHICISKLIIIGLDNGLAPGRRQAIIWTNVGTLSIGTLGTNFSEILIEI